MKNSIRKSIAAAAVTAFLALGAHGAEAPAAGYVDFGTLTPASGGEFVEVNLKSNLIAMAARFAQQQDPAVADIVRGVQQIHVNVIQLKEDNAKEVTERVRAIRDSLNGKGWERVVTAQQRKEDVSVCIRTREDEAVEGIVVTVLDGRQAVLVNVVGNIKPESLAVLGERLNIDPLKKAGLAVKKPSSEGSKARAK